jgi:Mg2+/citrate symporter
MKTSELILYFGVLKDSEILDEIKKEILRLRDQEDWFHG